MEQRRIIAAALLLGMGMGGFVDGIVFHQLLQSHNMLSARLPVYAVGCEEAFVNLQINMFWDGVFHAAVWLMTAAGLAMLWNAVRRGSEPLATRVFIGSLVLGWGIFNVVEGVIDHHLLQLHHVVEQADHIAWDWAFLGFGALLCLVGAALMWRGGRVPSR